MVWKLIAVPVIGAIIGYATNWIAVKMLFRPHHEVRLWGIKLPFTPGVIPKGQGRLARAVGKAVEEQLLTKEVLSRVLLSEETKNKVKAAVCDWIKREKHSTLTLEKAAVGLTSEETVEHFLEEGKEQVTEAIAQKITEMNPGKMVADKVLEAAKEKLAESMFGMMLGGSMLEPIAQMVEERLNEYLEDNGKEYIGKIVDAEADKLKEYTVGEVLFMLEEKGIDIPQIVVNVYEKLVNEKLADVMKALNLSGIVEDRINAMEVAEVEELLLSIMKKELRAVVNLGALIGLVLGLMNVAILCL
ncbi:MAG: DUF445 family protein [Eubacterium sp.]|nr:DUF445 family protein [Eubacterium sp.]